MDFLHLLDGVSNFKDSAFQVMYFSCGESDGFYILSWKN